MNLSTAGTAQNGQEDQDIKRIRELIHCNKLVVNNVCQVKEDLERLSVISAELRGMSEDVRQKASETIN